MHRGRIQSQGGGLNDSKPWALEAPLDCTVAIMMSHELEALASRREKKLRADAHRKSRAFMNAARAAGGTGPTSKTYMVKNDPHRRVDIEVHAGQAFV